MNICHIHSKVHGIKIRHSYGYRMRCSAFFTAILFGISCQSAFANLEWHTKIIHTQAMSTQEAVSAVFKFKNTGQTSVMFVSHEVSCGCMAPELPNGPIRPGEEGAVSMAMNIKGRHGRIEGTLRITTEPESPTAVSLAFVVDVTESISIRPRIVYWSLNEAPSPKLVQVFFADSKKHGEIGHIDGESDVFSATASPPQESGIIDIWIKARDTSRKASAIFKIKSITSGLAEEHLVYATIK